MKQTFHAADIYQANTPKTTWLCTLDTLSLLTITGVDAGSFLHAQTCNDVKHLAVGETQLNGYCTPKGRLLAIFRLLKLNEQHYQLQLSSTVAETLSQGLSFYKLRAQLTIAPDHAIGLGLIGEQAGELIKRDLGQAPKNNQAMLCDGYTISHESGFCPRYSVYGERQAIQDLQQLWAKSCENHPYSTWHLHTILNGIPTIYSATKEKFIPQMVNLDLVKGMSFDKGCYPGQEVVARTYYLGKLKQRMYLFVAPRIKVAVGDAVFIPKFSRDQPAGTVVDVEHDRHDRTIMLVSARLKPQDLKPAGDNEVYLQLNVELSAYGHATLNPPVLV